MGAPGAARCQLLGFRAATGDTTQLAPRATQRAGTSIVSEGDMPGAIHSDARITYLHANRKLLGG